MRVSFPARVGRPVGISQSAARYYMPALLPLLSRGGLVVGQPRTGGQCTACAARGSTATSVATITGFGAAPKIPAHIPPSRKQRSTVFRKNGAPRSGKKCFRSPNPQNTSFRKARFHSGTKRSPVRHGYRGRRHACRSAELDGRRVHVPSQCAPWSALDRLRSSP